MPHNNQSTSDLIQFFSSLPFLREVDRRSLERFVYACYSKEVAKDQILFLQDEPGETVFVVRHGKIAIILTTPDGRELVINEMLPGDLFGDIAAILGQPRSACAIAREASEVIVIPYDDFIAILEREPALIRHLLEVIAQRLRNSSERESALAFLAAPVRLARVLVQLSAQQKNTGGLVEVSQEELAQHIGVMRQTVAKILGQWRRSGWIITGRGKIMMVNWEAINLLAQEP
jgi:CRP/FNR family cyclic AMP-dependent transcriptional regulator